MNERIRELAEQADAYARTEYDKWAPTADFSGVPHVRAIYNQKFAELIVRECVSVIQGELDSRQYSQPVHTGFRVSKNLIKEHFGVEE